ncbi:MAG: isoprenylcysteine carboxyl methyltransferase [Alphaproteobacteria bacterium]|nr:isoprenylcysteine carboxyl methyltransferase [Alphaproteobacteria bacterium]MDX5368222.1 isoprenylcysteine carboxyl methyltransferase [Alphaproteobacteria bacterium]MDX5463031.1 isoprenylcysteine carboxyl methyltransferase [Alphaproteobacteria bacterium]
MSETTTPNPAAAPAETPARTRTAPPPSATVSWINFTGLAGFALALWAVNTWRPQPEWALLITFAGIAVPIVVLEWATGVMRIPFRPVDPPGNAVRVADRTVRVGLKLLGLGATLAAVLAVYWAFPVYRDGQAALLLRLVELVWLPLLLIAPFYVWVTDARMQRPEDGYLHAGLLLMGRWRETDPDVLRQHALGWLVKGFFLPLMLSFYANDLQWFLDVWWSRDVFALFQPGAGVAEWMAFYEWLYRSMFMVDVAFATVGYLLTLRLFDAQIRSTEPTLLGWLVCLACYPPFWGVVSGQYLAYDADNLSWGAWFWNHEWIRLAWSLMILACLGVYAWATVQFGIRFSNLTHRGVLTNGPFRWTKHPAYISKNISWWLLAVPFLSAEGPMEALRLSLLLAGVNLIYYLRARTEERHLRRDPVYVAYADWIAEHGALARLRRLVRPRRP